MDTGHLSSTAAAARRVRNAKVAPKRGRPRSANSKVASSSTPNLPSVGTLARTKALLLAALRVWELKHRVSDTLARTKALLLAALRVWELKHRVSD